MILLSVEACEPKQTWVIGQRREPPSRYSSFGGTSIMAVETPLGVFSGPRNISLAGYRVSPQWAARHIYCMHLTIHSTGRFSGRSAWAKKVGCKIFNARSRVFAFSFRSPIAETILEPAVLEPRRRSADRHRIHRLPSCACFVNPTWPDHHL